MAFITVPSVSDRGNSEVGAWKILAYGRMLFARKVSHAVRCMLLGVALPRFISESGFESWLEKGPLLVELADAMVVAVEAEYESLSKNKINKF
jgi:hypothetical protein